MSVGPLVVGAGLLLLTRAAHPGSYVTQVLPAVVVFGTGLAITVAPLTSTALGAAPSEHAGVASAVNNVVARAAGLLAVAVLPLLAGITGSAALEPLPFAAGFRTAMVIAGLTCAAGGVLAAATIRNPPGAQRLRRPRVGGYHCALDSTPLRAASAAGTPGPGLLSPSPRAQPLAGPRPGRGGISRPLPRHEPAVQVAHRGAAQIEEAGRGQAGGIALLADDDHRAARVLRLDQAV